MEEAKPSCTWRYVKHLHIYSAVAYAEAGMVAEQVEERKQSKKLPPFGHAPITF